MSAAPLEPLLFEARELAEETRETTRALRLDARQLRSEDTLDRLTAHGAWRAAHRLETVLDPEREAWIEDAWARLARELPAPLRPSLADLGRLLRRRRTMWADSEARLALSHALDRRARLLRLALRARVDENQRHELDEAERRVRDRASRSKRQLTPSEERRISLASAAVEPSAWTAALADSAERDEVLSVLAQMRLREAREQLSQGVLLTEQMRHIIDESLPALRRGEPMLLIGETGGGKTALAEYLSRSRLEAEPELISGYGDITGAQVMGSHELRVQDGAPVSVFAPGPLLRAMTAGVPVILDELNAMPPDFLKRLNRILQLRAGDRYSVQENAGEGVVVRPGFAVIATANEQTPHRYRGLDRLSSELVNRFGANTYRVHYPDSKNPYERFPSENALLAAASVVDERGRLPRTLPFSLLERVCRAAFISQQEFAGTNGEGFDAYLTTEREVDGRPGLEEAVLAPRTLVEILGKVAGSAGAVTLEHALGRFVEGIMHREDRRVLSLILQGQGFSVPPGT